MTSTGRNQPCPCGSGRKFKDCCAGSDEALLAAVGRGSARESAINKLLTFAFQPAFDSDHTVAEMVFWGDRFRNKATAHELQWLMDSEDATIKYNSWFLFDWDVDGNGTVADLFLEDEAAQLNANEEQFLTRLAKAHLRLYEVECVDRGRGVRLIDLWNGSQLFVIERTATRQIVTWDLLGARVAPDGLGGNVFEGGLYLYPADAKEHIVSHFRKLHRRYHRKFPTDDSAPFFRSHGMVFHHLWLDLVAFPEPPQVTTSDGHNLIFCRVVFDSAHVSDIRNTLSRQPQIRPLEDGRFGWYEQDEHGHEIGTWGFEAERVVLETTSQERAVRGRAWLERLVGDLVRYRATALETIDQAMNELRRQRPMTIVQEPAPGDTVAVREMYDRHYHTWLDRPVAALGNRTPRAAAQTKVWRPRLIDLLKQIENGSERAALAGRPPYDFAWIWKELGLERPDI